MDYKSFRRALFEYIQDADFGRDVVTNYYRAGDRVASPADDTFAKEYLTEDYHVREDIVTVNLDTSGAVRDNPTAVNGFCIRAEILYEIFQAATDKNPSGSSDSPVSYDSPDTAGWNAINMVIRQSLKYYDQVKAELGSRASGGVGKQGIPPVPIQVAVDIDELVDGSAEAAFMLSTPLSQLSALSPLSSPLSSPDTISAGKITDTDDGIHDGIHDGVHDWAGVEAGSDMTSEALVAAEFSALQELAAGNGATPWEEFIRKNLRPPDEVARQIITMLPLYDVLPAEMPVVVFNSTVTSFMMEPGRRLQIVYNVLTEHHHDVRFNGSILYHDVPESRELEKAAVEDLVLYGMRPVEEELNGGGSGGAGGAGGGGAAADDLDGVIGDLIKAVRHIRSGKMSKALEAWGREYYRIIVEG